MAKTSKPSKRTKIKKKDQIFKFHISPDEALKKLLNTPIKNSKVNKK
jgi:hypothetical protein